MKDDDPLLVDHDTTHELVFFEMAPGDYAMALLPDFTATFRLALLEAMAQERLPPEVIEAMGKTAENLNKAQNNHFHIMTKRSGVIGCTTNPTPETTIHILTEDPGCWLEECPTKICPHCQEDDGV